MECDEYEEKKASDAAPLFQAPDGPGLAPRLEFAAARGRKLDQLEGAILGHCCKCFGRERPRGAEMAQRCSPAIPVETAAGANFVLSPHDFEYFISETGRHRSYSAGNRPIPVHPYGLDGMISGGWR